MIRCARAVVDPRLPKRCTNCLLRKCQSEIDEACAYEEGAKFEPSRAFLWDIIPERKLVLINEPVL